MSPITADALNGGKKHPEQRRFDSALVEDWRARRWSLLLHSEDILKMEIEEIDVASLRKSSDRELLSLHRRTHQLWSKVKPYEKMDGLYLVAPHAQWIWEGKKRLIVKSKKFNVEGKKYYLIQDKVYGTIEMGAPYSINLEEFKKLSKLHLVSEKERLKWWPDYKTLYAYPIKRFKKFPTPKDYDRVPQAQVFLKDVEPRNKISRSDIKKAHELIVAEILRRNMEHKTPLEDSKTEKTSKSIPDEINMIYDEEYFKGLEDPIMNFIIDFAEVIKYMLGAADNVLEMGCGTGRALEILGDSGVKAIGIDAADKAIEMCKELKLNAQKMDAHLLDFRNGMFDTVFSMHLLEHLEDPMMAINESLRVARKRAIHLVPLGKRGDPTHLWEFLSIENLRAFAGPMEIASHFHRIPTTDCGIIVFDKELRADTPFFKHLDSLMICPGYISLAGGSIKNSEPDDLDIIIRDEIPNDSVEIAMRNLFPDEETRKRLHFTYHASGPLDDSIPLYDKICQLRSDFTINRVDLEKRELKPITHFTPLKTGRGYTQLEFFAPEELWEKWAKPLMDEGIDIDVERKFGGWRAIAQMDEKGKTYIYFDDTKTDRSKQFPSIVSDLKAIGEPVILDLDLGAVYSDGRPVDRVDLGFGGKVVIPESGKFKTKDGLDAMLVGNVFGTLYYGEDLHTKPWSEMRKKLEEIFGKHNFRFLKLVKKNITKNKKQFLAEVARVSKLPGSEGAVPKAVNSDYPLTGMTPSWAKIKNALEIKVQVDGRTPVKDKDTWTYDISCLGENGKPIDLGKTMNTKLDAKTGDIITISVQEVIPDWDEERGWVIAIVVPIVQNIDPGRKRPETVKEIIIRADKANILQASPAMRDKLRGSKILVRKFIEELADCLDEEKRDALRPQPGFREGLAREVVSYIPPHKTYVEPLAGGGRALMKKEPSDVEVLSDVDPEVMFMFKAAKSFTPEEIKKLKNMDWTRTESKWLQLKKLKFKDKLREFYRLMYVRRCSFGYYEKVFVRNIAGKKIDFSQIEPWLGVKGRLGKVKLLTCDYAIAIKRFDGPNTFFHIDPPFIGHTESGGWKKWKGFDFERLFKTIKQIKGKWLLAIDDVKEIKKIFSGYHIKEIKAPTGQLFTFNPGKIDGRETRLRTELLISNYKLEKTGGDKAKTTEKVKKPEAKITLKEGDEGDGVIQTHELGLTEDQVKLLGPDFSFGWDPVEVTENQFDRLHDIQDISWEALVKKASEGDSSDLGKVIKKIDKEKLTIPQRKLIALIEPVSVHSVPVHTPILVRCSNGGLDLRSISGWFRQDKRGQPIKELEGCSVLSNPSFTEIIGASGHKLQSRILRVVCDSGIVDVTEGHSVVLENGSVCSATDLNVGDRLLTTNLPSLPEKICLDPDFAWALGLFAAEGTANIYRRAKRPKKYSYELFAWTISNKNKDFLELAKKGLSKIGMETEINNYPANKGVLTLRLTRSQKGWAAIFSDWFYEIVGKYTRHKKIPSLILNADRLAKEAFLKGLYAGDGNSNIKNGWVVKTKFPILAQGIILLLNDLGYIWGVGCHEKKYIAIKKLKRLNNSRTNRRRNEISAIHEFKLSSSQMGRELIYPPDGWVYDFSTRSQEFAAGIGNIVVHNTDIRLHPKGAPYWEGGEGFTPGNQFQINKFTLLNKDAKVKILMDFKRPRKGTGRVETIRGPLIWMKVGLKKPQSFPPGSVGSTAKAWARFTVRDSFDWKAGTQDPHYKEFKFDDKVLKGRHIMAFAPLPGREQRMWLFSRPGEQRMDAERKKSIVKILKIDNERRTVLGVVLEPETFDAQNEIISASVIEKTAHDFLANYNQKTKLGYMHTFFEPDLQLYECYIAPMDMVIEGTKIKKGSWLMLSKVNDDHIWQQVKDKKITGYSIAGIAVARAVE